MYTIETKAENAGIPLKTVQNPVNFAIRWWWQGAQQAKQPTQKIKTTHVIIPPDVLHSAIQHCCFQHLETFLLVVSLSETNWPTMNIPLPASYRCVFTSSTPRPWKRKDSVRISAALASPTFWPGWTPLSGVVPWGRSSSSHVRFLRQAVQWPFLNRSAFQVGETVDFQSDTIRPINWAMKRTWVV